MIKIKFKKYEQLIKIKHIIKYKTNKGVDKYEKYIIIKWI